MLIRNRGYLPHLEARSGTYFVTFRLAGTLPQNVLDAWRFEREDIVQEAARQGRSLSKFEEQRLKELYSERVESYLDRSMGECWLRNPVIGEVVVAAIKRFDAVRYDLHAWCVMPNHVHVVVTPTPSADEVNSCLVPVLHSWKSFSGHKANQILRRSGKFWQEEYYDHLIRTDHEFVHYEDYTLRNPVKAGLCKKWQDWPWSGCRQGIERKLMNS